MPGHSRLKDGVASACLCPGIHALTARQWEGRGWPGHLREDARSLSSGRALRGPVGAFARPWRI